MTRFRMPMAKILILCFLLHVITPTASALDYSRAETRETCDLLLSAISSGSKKFWAATKKEFSDPKRLSFADYQALASKPIESYFENDSISPEKLQEFVNDFGLILHNYNRARNNGKPFHGIDQVKDDFNKTSDTYHQGLAQNKRHRTLEDLLIDLQREVSHPDEQDSLKTRTIRLASNLYLATTSPSTYPRLAIKGAKLIINIPGLFVKEVRDNLKTAFAVAVVVPLIGSYTGLFTNPISNFLSTKANAQFGWIEMYLTLFLTDLDRKIERMESIFKKMAATKQEMETVSIKYKMKGLSEEQARKKWIELEEVFVNYGREMNSLLPDNIARGRSYARDAAIAYPLIYANALTSSQTEILGFENLIMEYEQLEKKSGELSAADKKRLNELVERHKISKDRMGGVLATIMLHDMMYPELFRPGFLNKNSTNKLLHAQPAIMGALNFEDYQTVYLDSMQKVLNQMGINLDSLKEERKHPTSIQVSEEEALVVKPTSEGQK